jgi:hypothetical protein
MSRLLKQMSLIVSTELQQIAIDLYEKIDEDKPIKFIRLKDEFKYSPSQYQQHQQQICSSSSSTTSSSNSSQSTSQFKQITSSCNVNTTSNTNSNTTPNSISPKQYVNNKSTSDTVNQATSISGSSSTQLIKQQHQQINSIQMNNLTASFKKVDLSKPNVQQTTTTTTTIVKSAKLAQIFNPKKDLEQFISQDQKSQQDLASFRTSLDRCNTSSFFYSDTY